MHVLSEIIPAGPDPLLMPVMPPQFYEENEGRAKETLKQPAPARLGQAAQAGHGGAVGKPGRSHRRLLQGAAIDLIVIATHGRTGLSATSFWAPSPSGSSARRPAPS